jgi:hypothetical protein
MTITPLTAPPASSPRAPQDAEKPAPYSREYFLARLGPELMADIERRVAEAPAPSPAKVEQVRRLFAAVPLPRS